MDRSGDAHDQYDGSASCEYLLQDSLLLSLIGWVRENEQRGKFCSFKTIEAGNKLILNYVNLMINRI